MKQLFGTVTPLYCKIHEMLRTLKYIKHLKIVWNRPEYVSLKANCTITKY